MKRVIFIISSIFLTVQANAQQLPQYSQYLRNQYMVNPGSAGVYDFLDVTVSGRLQWAGFDNAPKTTYLSATKPLNKIPKTPYNPAIRTSTGVYKNPEIKTGKFKQAIGGQLIADQYGAFRKLSLSGTYAIHIPVSKNYNLSFGTKLGLSSNSFLQEKAVVLNSASDNSYQTFVANNKSKYIMDLGAGLYLYSKDLFFGISADQLTKDFVNFGSSSSYFDPRMTFYFTGGYKIKVNKDLTLTPAALVKYMKPAPASVEGTVLLEYQERIWGGLSYRHKDAIIAMFGLNINEKFKLGYSYDYSISRMNKYSSGGHELVLGLMIGR
ncbi:MAG: type IX secretion system membrane protein PorP/SprF [Flavobacteriia bacterium]